MKKYLLMMILPGLLFGTISCKNSKEQQMKALLGLPQTAPVDPVAQAEKNPGFDTEIAAGLSLSRSQQPDKALVYFERALKRNPNSAIANNNVCAEYNGMKQWDKAIPYCEKAIAVDASFQLAKNNLKFSQDQKALQLQKIEKLQAQVGSSKGKARRIALVDLGFERYRMGDFETAVSVWKRVEKGQDDIYVRTLNNMGSAYIILKKFDLAEKALNEANRLDPQNQLVKNNMGWLKSASAQK